MNRPGRPKLLSLWTTSGLYNMPEQNSILDNGQWEEVKPGVFGQELKQQPLHTRAAKWTLDILRPSIFKKQSAVRKQELRSTAYLDGLRGFAAFLVYWGHHQLWARDSIGADKIFENGFGYDGQYYFVQLPIIRMFFSGGHFAVTVFFVISGYVLSRKPLQLIQAGEYLKLGDNLTSAMFRRWLRLHIPIIATTFLFMTSWHAFGIWVASSDQESNYRDEVWKWYAELKNFTFAFRSGGEPWFSYSFHVWSIPVEFRGSVIVYTSLLAFSRCTRTARLWCEVALIFYFMYIVDGWFGSLFMSGLLLCDLDLLAASHNLPRFLARLEPIKELIYYNLFFISLYLGGVPSHSSDITALRDTPGWYYLSFLKPQAVFDFKWFFLFWAATLLIVSVPRIHWLKAFFETRFNQYLGRISFSFYLVHGPVMWILGDRLYVATGWSREIHAVGLPNWINAFPISKAGPMGLDLAFWLPHLILLPVTLWCAEIATRCIDDPSIKFSQWLYRKTLAPATGNVKL